MADSLYKDETDTEAVFPKNVLNTIPTKRNDDSFYTLVVKKDNYFDTVDRYIPLDIVTDCSIEGTSDITSYPLITGDIMSDHKYDNPKTVSLSGVFSLNGKFNDSFVQGGNATSRLVNIEDYFFACRKYGKLMSLICVSSDGTRFSMLDNLSITSIRFKRNYNSMEYSFNFKEVYFFEADTDIQVSENVKDPNALTLGEFESLDFTKQVLSAENVDKWAVQVLYQNGLIEDSFIKMVSETGKLNSTVNYNFGLAWVGFYGGLATTLATLIFPNPVSVVVGAFLLIITLPDIIKHGKWIEPFKGYDNDVDNDREINRFLKVITTIESQVSYAADNLGIRCYGLSSNLKKQKMYLTIDNTIYAFYFEKLSTGFWGLSVTDIDENPIASNSNKLIGFKDLFQLKKADAMFKTSQGTYVYVINLALQYLDLPDDQLKAVLEDQWKNGESAYLGYTEDEMKAKDNPPSDLVSRFREEGVYKDLTKFIIVATKQDMEKVKDDFNDNIEACFKKDIYND